jgi:hypothetical protein
MTITGVNLTVAAAIVAAIGDIGRFKSPGKLVSYFGLNPRVRQSGLGAAHHGRISKIGRSHARAMLVEAAWAAARALDRLMPSCTKFIGEIPQSDRETKDGDRGASVRSRAWPHRRCGRLAWPPRLAAARGRPSPAAPPACTARMLTFFLFTEFIWGMSVHYS